MEITMQVTCAGCKSIYTLTPEQIRGLSFSIFPCRSCNKFIKIAACPDCGSYYAMTFSSAGRKRYHLACERCARPFTIDFPVIKDAEQAAAVQPRAARGRPIVHIIKKIFRKDDASPAPRDPGAGGAAAAVQQYRPPSSSSIPVSITLGDVFTLCGSAFDSLKLLTAAAAVVLSLILMYGYDRLARLALSAGGAAPDASMKSLLSIIPFALVFFAYVMAAAVIARITMEERMPAHGARRLASMVARSVAPVFIANIILFLAVDAILILFGLIPVIGPFLFALAFLPVYGISICVIILIAIGSWFYPPVIAATPTGAVSPMLGLLRFIRRHNLRLAYIIPLMAMITAVAFAAVYLVHYGSISLSIAMAKTILADDGDKIFSAIPPALIQLSDFTVPGPDPALFRSFASDLLWSHTAAGVIMGIIFSLIALFLFALFISLTATLSTRIYLMMESGTDMDDASKLRILLLLVLMLAGIYLLKKLVL